MNLLGETTTQIVIVIVITDTTMSTSEKETGPETEGTMTVTADMTTVIEDTILEATTTEVQDHHTMVMA